MDLLPSWISIICISAVGDVWEISLAHPKYRTYDARLPSFEGWPSVIKQRPDKLTEPAFFYAGDGDETMHFHCGRSLKYWDEMSNPWVEHAVWFSKCLFMLLAKGKVFLDNICLNIGARIVEKNAASIKPPSNLLKATSEHNVTVRASNIALVCHMWLNVSDREAIESATSSWNGETTSNSSWVKKINSASMYTEGAAVRLPWSLEKASVCRSNYKSDWEYIAAHRHLLLFEH
ncbi:putative inhibitor of apoptosis [Schistocerca americana]|uniref:putative inhibitor of apoptosis n=1 Tax=Schistocerca americana TaxID=7009 RepID=UPI001F4FF947|nr:putative inhibitor of apoptosis [Schistocerca americana]